MPRIRNVLQQRADRFRKKQKAKEKMASHEEPVPLSPSDDNRFTSEFVKPRMEPDGDRVSGSAYSLEAKDTTATVAETFSAEENTDYSDESRHDRNEFQDGGEFIDLAYEAGGKGEFIDLVRESARTERNGVNRSNYNDYQDEEDEIVTMLYPQPDTIAFVDSEDGQVFEIPKEGAKPIAGLLQNVRSLDESHTTYNDECSKTLNTNHETIQTDPQSIDHVPSENEENIGEMTLTGHFRTLQVDVEQEESYDNYGQDVDTHYDHEYDNEDMEEVPIVDEDNISLYDCDDGEMYFPKDSHGSEPNEYDEDGTFFGQIRCVQSRVQSHHSRGYLSGDLDIVDGQAHVENWDPISQQTHLQHPENRHLIKPNDAPNSPQLEDPYLSDGNSSWEEGSFATGASRAVSRVDTAYDDDDDDDGTYDGTFDGTEYYSDDNTYATYATYADDDGERPFIRMLKSLRDMTVDDECSDNENSDEDDDEAEEKRHSRKQRRRRRSKKATVFERISEMGKDLLNETIEHAERQDMSPRGRNSRQGGTILNSFEALFSCGASSGY